MTVDSFMSYATSHGRMRFARTIEKHAAAIRTYIIQEHTVKKYVIRVHKRAVLTWTGNRFESVAFAPTYIRISH